MNGRPTSERRISVLMSYYANAIPRELDIALESLWRQTMRPYEIVLVRDGPVGRGLAQVVARWHRRIGHRLVLVENPSNLGLGLALRRGLRHCRSELVARMDADDISARHRLKCQYGFMAANPDVDVVSAWTAAFEENPEKILFVRKSPKSHEALARLARFRSPVSHGASMFRKDAVLAAGSYLHMSGLEDYHLWARMLKEGSRFATIPEVLYLVRWSRQRTSERRAGIKRALAQARLQQELCRMGFITPLRSLVNTSLRVLAAMLPSVVTHRARRLARI